jgi:hypothetical protein
LYQSNVERVIATAQVTGLRRNAKDPQRMRKQPKVCEK